MFKELYQEWLKERDNNAPGAVYLCEDMYTPEELTDFGAEFAEWLDKKFPSKTHASCECTSAFVMNLCDLHKGQEEDQRDHESIIAYCRQGS